MLLILPSTPLSQALDFSLELQFESLNMCLLCLSPSWPCRPLPSCTYGVQLFWSSVIVLVSSSTDLVSCVISGSVSIEWFCSSLWVVFPCFLAYLVIWDWIPDIVNFTLLSGRHFYIPLEIPEFFSGLQISHLETVQFWWSFLWSFAKWNHSSQGSIFPHRWGKALLSIVPSALRNVRLFRSGW